jgi:predicted DNA-binding transcriptional regulator AlpA
VKPNPDEREDFLTINQLLAHSGMPRRTLMKWLHHPLTPIPHRKIGRRVFVLVSEYRQWADQFKVKPTIINVRELVDDVVSGLARR